MPLFPLYGGAVTTELPANLIDVSQIREIPDTQEVFLLECADDPKLDQSFIFDLLESVEAASIEALLKTHIDEVGDIKDGRISPYKVIRNETLNTDCYFAFFVQNSPKKDKYASISMVSLIQLKSVATDVIITLNVPILQEEESTLTLEKLECEIADSSSSLARSYKMIEDATKHYSVKQWGLFG